MLIYHHLQSYNTLTETQNFRLHNVGSLSTGGNSTAKGLIQYLTTDDRVYVHQGSGTWKKLLFQGDSMANAELSLATDHIWVGVSNLATATAMSAVSLSKFAVPTGNLSLNGYKYTNSATVTSGDADSTLATVGFVKSVAQGLDPKLSCLLASDTNFASTYNTGTHRLTRSSNGAITATTLDSGAGSSTLIVGSRVLLKAQTTTAHNGIYEVIDLGSAGTPAILERTDDADSNSEIENAFTFIQEGTFINTGWIQTSASFDITVPSGDINWAQFSGAGTYTAGNGLIAVGSSFHFAKSTSFAQGEMFYGITGGSGDAGVTKIQTLAIGANGRFMQSNGSAPLWSGYGMPTSAPAANSLLYSDGSNIVALSSTANRVLISNGSGVPTWGNSLPSGVTLNGATIYTVGGTDISLADGGTNASLSSTPGAIVYGVTNAMAFSSVGSAGQFLRSGGTGAPTWFSLFTSNNTWSADQTITDLAALHFVSPGDSNPRLSLSSSGDIFFGDGTTSPSASISFTGTAAAPLISFGLTDVRIDGGNVLRFGDSDSSHFVGLKAPATVSSNKTWTLPSNDVASGFWKSNGSGTLSVAALTVGDIGSGAALSVSDGGDANLDLNISGGSASLLAAATITIGWTGLLSVARGGTGVSSLTNNAVLIGNGSSLAFAAPSANTVLASSGGAPAFTGQPTLATGIITQGQSAVQIGPFGVSAGNTGEIRFLELAANGSSYVGFKAPDSITSNLIWRLPATDAVGYFKSDGSGNMSIGSLSVNDVSNGAELSRVNDTNVLVTLSANAPTALLKPVSMTLGWQGQLAVSRGGTGQGSALTQQGLIYASSTTAMACTAAPVGNNAILLGKTSGAPTWTPYTMPSSLSAANHLVITTSSTAIGTLAPAANSVLVTDGSSVPSWGGKLNVARNTAGGIARKWSNLVQGDNANAFITVAHNLGTRDVYVCIRSANSGDTGEQEIAYTKVVVTSTNEVRIHFATTQTSSNYYVVTIFG